ncbi:MAG TPA: hypothetical protein VES96_02760 [Nitrospiraceae bacterium]|nr:hypothetical protein [Nitrospiraceae bacterium]
MAAIVLWVIAASIVGWIFVKGWATQGTDGRTEIALAPSERDRVLREMRELLKAVHGVITGLSDPAQGMKEAEHAARAAGMGMAADVDPAMMAKLPLPFKQMGMSVHQDMDRLADAIARKEDMAKILNRVSSITARCTTCHDLYRFSLMPAATGERGQAGRP